MTDREKAAYLLGLVMGVFALGEAWVAADTEGVWRGMGIAGAAMLVFAAVVFLVVEKR